MRKIFVSELTIGDEKRVALKFKYDETIINIVKGLDGRVWSNSKKIWHIPYTSATLEKELYEL
ncbi:MAG: hypothetical protein JXR48_04005 [Candidatus Delongbacteria bacterium]|nr:hypothetical protein [Candidatus Delongbacteria bacterium]